LGSFGFFLISGLFFFLLWVWTWVLTIHILLFMRDSSILSWYIWALGGLRARAALLR
jgi:hypothetical protein